MKNPFDLEGKTILITGASSGIGRGIAIACAGMGARVILTARCETRLRETLTLCEGEGHLVIVADLTKEKERNKLVDSIPELNGFVQCAGVGNRVPCKQISEDDIRYVFQPNVEAPMLLQAELLQKKKVKQGASIVYIASSAATMPSIANSVYSASKGAIIAYTKCLAQELALRKIRVNTISPAMVMTNLALVGATQDELNEAETKYPLKRYGRPKDIAYMAVFLLSDASEWMTGSNIKMTGGTLVL